MKKKTYKQLNQLKPANIAALLLLICPFAAAAQQRREQALSPSFRALLTRQARPLPANFNFAAPTRHIFHITDEPLPNDPFINPMNGQTPLQWGPVRTETHLAWQIWQPKNVKPVVIAIVDTGVDDAHPDLTNMMLRDANGVVIGYNVLTGIVGPTPPDNPHGTHCAGIAAAESNNGIGMAGMAGWNGNPNVAGTSHVRIMPVKVLDASGSGADTDVATGIDWAVAHGANIINLSVGDTEPSPPVAQSVVNAWNAGCLVICAAGNQSNTAYFYPAASPNAVSVAATSNTITDDIPGWSTRGGWVNLAAPGENIYSTFPGNNYTYLSGTSMACPHVVGLAALVWAQNPTLKNIDVYNFIRQNVDPYPALNDPIEMGSGRINSNTTLKAVNTAMGTLNGTVSLEGCINTNQAVNFRFRSTDGSLDFTYSANLTAGASPDTGVFTLSNLPAATYNVSVKGAKWLQANVPVTISTAPSAGATLSVSLLAGDANNDNIVDTSDLGVLVGSYGSDGSVPGSGYEPAADFDCDGAVDSTDFGLLIGNYGRQGDE